MSTINETQRKYLSKRLESLGASKRNEILKAYTLAPLWRDSNEKADYVNAEFARVGLAMSAGRYVDYLTTPRDIEYKERLAAVGLLLFARLKELSALQNKIMDDLMLGGDAEILREAIDSLGNFAPTNGELN